MVGSVLCLMMMLICKIIDYTVFKAKDDITLAQVLGCIVLGVIPIFQLVLIVLMLIWLLFDVAPKVKVYKPK